MSFMEQSNHLDTININYLMVRINNNKQTILSSRKVTENIQEVYCRFEGK